MRFQRTIWVWALAILVYAVFFRTAAADSLYVSMNNGGASGAGSILTFKTPSPIGSNFVTGLTAPRGLAFGANGNLYVGDGNSIDQITPGGAISVFTNVPSYEGLAFDSQGNLYVADISNGRVLKIAPNGSQTVFAGGFSLNSVFGLAFDKQGNLFVASAADHKIEKVAPDGTQSVFASLSEPVGMAFDSQGNLFVANQDAAKQVFEIHPDGSELAFGTVGDIPVGVAVDSHDNVFVSFSGSGPNAGGIYEFSPGGSRTLFAGGLNQPTFMTFDEQASAPLPSVAFVVPAILASVILVRRRRACSLNVRI